MVESGGLENRCTRKGTVGSNPTLSARNQKAEGKRQSIVSRAACVLTAYCSLLTDWERCRSG